MPYRQDRRTEERVGVEIGLEGIAKRFGGTAALRDISLAVRSGELMALLGPSGSGKTTLLRVIAGLETADAGRVLFDGRDTTRLPVQRRRVGFVFQHYALFRHLTVFDNIAYGLRARARAERPSAPAIRARVFELLELTQLAGLERRFPVQLSGGQRQRVALARALAVDPQVLLLDEPFGALDAKVRKDLRRWLREIHERSGKTTLFVTHDQDEALELADRVAILHQGVLQQVGTPDEVYDTPANPFVMSFVGETSKLPVRVANGEVWLAQSRLEIDARGTSDGPADLYLRPSNVVVDPDRQSGLDGTVRAIRRTGETRRLEVQLHATTDVVEVNAVPDDVSSLGENVWLRILRGRVFTPEALDKRI
jgi:sulfate transport system ATP-binding protein